MDTQVLHRFRELGGEALLDRLVELHIARSQDKLRQIAADCRGNRFDDARAHASELLAFAEEVGQDELIPTIRRFQSTLGEGTLGAVNHDLRLLALGVNTCNDRLRRSRTEL